MLQCAAVNFVAGTSSSKPSQCKNGTASWNFVGDSKLTPLVDGGSGSSPSTTPSTTASAGGASNTAPSTTPTQSKGAAAGLRPGLVDVAGVGSLLVAVFFGAAGAALLW